MKRKSEDDSKLSKELAERFKKTLIEDGIKPAEIIKRTGIEAYTVSRLYSDEPIVSMVSMVKIARAFNTSLDHLFGFPTIETKG